MVNRFKLIRQASRNPKEQPKTENRSNTVENNPNVCRLKLKKLNTNENVSQFIYFQISNFVMCEARKAMNDFLDFRWSQATPFGSTFLETKVG